MSILEPTNNPDIFINTKTNRKVKRNSQQYNKIIAEELQSASKEDEQIDDKIEKKTKKVLKTIVSSNQKKLNRSDDPETELRRLLYEKLCLVDKKKIKKKVRYESSSSDSETSDSD